ncbi:DUF389 domain-containing protein [Kamptonema sp. UHCC 0994]|uniref:DUF389 domain-containing protein n=1 Tax=Kamptonema sp. UHCC 0994 TaxID=3031329 RepID=UPI0023B9C3E5|nr:DUF389 domain-containing protein [Kamptonema sp. UHCC 0994]MDF0551798.1 DUF389 domain-containing protein [Kamptonema sp. UHCC 0994]
MNKSDDIPTLWQNYRNWLGMQMGVDEQRKAEVYLEISQAATLRDASYWLQVVFAAGIATLGLILNSPAVIIGAMLISPLMGPILSLGLALATGDFVLLARAIANLTLSCAVAISFAVILIFLLPFKEITSEIAGRTQPNTLDLVIALFSGAVGALATCRPIKGVVNSIPGAAIAVALMPPLCVVGYGIGTALSLNQSDGFQTARGGGLLFITNLVAIAFSSLLVFLALHIDTDTVREKVRIWETNDLESDTIQQFLGRYPFLQKLRPIGSLPGRLLVGLLAIVALLIPLSNAFVKLGDEVAQKQRQNFLRRTVTEVWQRDFSTLPDGQPRSTIERVAVREQDRLMNLQLNIFTSKLYSPVEKERYIKELAQKFDKEPKQIQFTLNEIPIASNEILAKQEEVRAAVETPAPNFNELQGELLQKLNSSLINLALPPKVQLLDYAVTTSKAQSMMISITYLSDRSMSEDARSLVIQDIRSRLGVEDANVKLEQIDSLAGEILFELYLSTLPSSASSTLDKIGTLLNRYPSLSLIISVSRRSSEQINFERSRYAAISSYLYTKWQIGQERLTLSPQSSISNQVTPIKLPQDGKTLLRLTVKN